MNCATCEQNLPALLDPESAPALVVRLQEHIARCPRCETLYRELRQVDDLFSQAGAVEPSPALWLKIRSQMDATPDAAGRPAGWGTWLWGARGRWAGALGLCAVLGLSAAIGLYEHKTQRRQEQWLAQIDAAQQALLSAPERNPFAALAARHQKENPFREASPGGERNPFKAP